MSDTPITHEAVERWQQGKINIFDEMARLERERDTACRLLAQMHAAAVGEIQGPDIDPVTDILNLKKERDQWSEVADKLAEALFIELSGTMTLGGLAHGALTDFYRLKEEAK